MTRLNIERQKQLEPRRTKSTKQILQDMGFAVSEVGKCLEFEFKGHTVKFFPYSGWHTGKSITDGRGFNNLIKQLK